MNNTLIDQTAGHELSRDERIKLENNRLGLLLFQFSWILVFVCLVFVNIQIRWNHTAWPPPGVERLNAVLPTLATILLAVSVLTIRRGSDALLAGDTKRFAALWRLTFLFGAVFVAVMTYEWLVVPDSAQYSMIFRVMTAFHATHALVIGFYLWRVYRYAQTVGYTQHNIFAVEAGIKLWDFVLVAWLLFFVVLYIV